MSASNISARAPLAPRWILAVLAFALLGSPASARAGAAEPGDAPPQAQAETAVVEGETPAPRSAHRLFEELLVVGVGELRVKAPGSAHVIDAEALARQDYQDVHRVLRQVPGLNIQEEDGFGLRPNIGIRGTGVERSSKITLLEDGVLIAPAPYAAPAAYYSPTAGRMEGFEIRKGSSSVRQGPFTNGGSINYLSRTIPRVREGDLEVAAGSDGLQRLQATFGDGGERVSWLVQGYDLSHDGFKNLDDGGATGFELSDYMGKLRVTSAAGARLQQALEVKLGRTEQHGDETYLGLAAADFAADPFRRYAASSGDRIDTEHEQVQLSWEVRPSDRMTLTTTVYRNDFFRNWAKLEQVNGVRVASVLADPESHGTELAILRGERDSAEGALAVRNNRRDYYSQGLQTVLDIRFDRGRAAHELDLGLRVHEDEEDRFQENDGYQILGGQRVFNFLGAPGSNANRVASAEAVALFVQDTIRFGRWTLTPGARVESIDLTRLDYGSADPERTGADLGVRENSLTEVIPGLGAAYDLGADGVAFVGIHKGFSPPGPGSTEATAEESVNYEVGYRFERGSRRAEIVGFLNDYDNLLGTDTTSGGGDGTGDQFNGGAATVVGIEAGFGANLWTGKRLVLPVNVSYTYTDGEFDSSFETGFADWAPEVTAGDAIPFLPPHQLNATLSLRSERWALHLDGNYVARTRIKAGSGPAPAAETVDSRAIFDLRGEVDLTTKLSVFAQVLNATDELYVAARRPAGLRPGIPRSVSIGLRARLGENR